MCGIVCIVATERHLTSGEAQSTELMLDSLAHRGPDGRSSVVALDAKVALGHVRLAIIRTDSLGNQPMRSVSGRSWITYNGEIYNYKELGKKHRLPESIVDQGDTAVLLELLEREGMAILPLLRGMFAFVYANADRVIAARDEFGIKPLYFRQSGDIVAFSSEARSLNILTPSGISEDAVRAYLKAGSVSEPAAAFEGLQALPCGTALTIDLNQQSQPTRGHSLHVSTETWAPPFSVRTSTNVGHRIASHTRLRETLIDSVASHFTSDVPVGVMLSAGVDSSLILFIARKCLNLPTSAITLGLNGAALDESDAARDFAGKMEVDHFYEELVPSSLEEIFDEFMDAMDSPSVDGLNTFLLCKGAKRHGMKVLLSGLGADEILAGYPCFKDIPRILKFRQVLDSIPYASGLLRYLLSNAAPGTTKQKLRSVLSEPATIAHIYPEYRSLFERNTFEFTLGKHLSEGTSAPIAQLGVTSISRAISLLELQHYLRNQLLKDSDVFSMAHGIELRVPFLDRAFVDAALDATSQEPPGMRKREIIRKAFPELPGFFPFGPKRGFSLPMNLWLSSGYFRDLMGTRRTYDPIADFVPWRIIESVNANFSARKVHWSRPWSLLVLAEWAKRNAA